MIKPASPGEVRLYHLDGLDEAYVLKQWDINLGDRVVEGHRIAIVEGEPFTMEVCGFDDGVVAEMNAMVGRPIPDGALIARIQLDQ